MPGDRDKLVHKTPPAGVRAQTASPVVEIDDETSGAYDDPGTRAEYRAGKPIGERVAAIEPKVDMLTAGHALLIEDVKVIAAAQAKTGGQLTFLVKSAGLATAERKWRRQREAEVEQRAADAAKQKAELIDKALERRSITRRIFIRIIVPTIVALGGLITAIAAGIR